MEVKRKVLNALHLTVSVLFVCLGMFQFFSPHLLARVLGLDDAIMPSMAYLVGQTSGMQFFFLGFYDLVAVSQGWDIWYFYVLMPFRFLFCLAYMSLYFAASTQLDIHWLVVIPAVLQFILAFGTDYLTKGKEPKSPPFHWSWLSVSQIVHALPQSTFATLMMGWPEMVLPFMTTTELPLTPSAIFWGRMMGVQEIIIVAVYGLSGLYKELRPFAVLSVFTRLGAFVILIVCALAGICTTNQAMGCIPDASLGLLTWLCLYLSRETKKTKKIE